MNEISKKILTKAKHSSPSDHKWLHHFENKHNFFVIHNPLPFVLSSSLFLFFSWRERELRKITLFYKKWLFMMDQYLFITIKWSDKYQYHGSFLSCKITLKLLGTNIHDYYIRDIVDEIYIDQELDGSNMITLNLSTN